MWLWGQVAGRGMWGQVAGRQEWCSSGGVIPEVTGVSGNHTPHIEVKHDGILAPSRSQH